MKYEIGTKIGKLKITHYNAVKCYYTFTCKCGRNFTSTSQSVRHKQEQIALYGTAACKICMNDVRRSLLSDGEFFLPIYKQYKRDAANKRRPFKLSLSQAIELFKSRCHYCDSQPSNSIKIGKRFITYQGIDRMEQNEGYLASNVVPCL